VGGESGFDRGCIGLYATGHENAKRKRAEARFEDKCNKAAQKVVDERIARMRARTPTQVADLKARRGYDVTTDPLLVSRSGPEYDRIVSEAFTAAARKAGFSEWLPGQREEWRRDRGFGNVPVRGTFAEAAPGTDYRGTPQCFVHRYVRMQERDETLAARALAGRVEAAAAAYAATLAVAAAPAIAAPAIVAVKQVRVTRASTAAAAAAAAAALAAPHHASTAPPLSDDAESHGTSAGDEDESEWVGSDDCSSNYTD
jgi:hypothetical protein